MRLTLLCEQIAGIVGWRNIMHGLKVKLAFHYIFRMNAPFNPYILLNIQ